MIESQKTNDCLEGWKRGISSATLKWQIIKLMQILQLKKILKTGGRIKQHQENGTVSKNSLVCEINSSVVFSNLFLLKKKKNKFVSFLQRIVLILINEVIWSWH